MLDVLTGALRMSEMLWEHERQGHDLASPEQKAGSAPVMTRQRAVVVRTASSSSAYVVNVSALRASGRCRVTTATLSFSS